MQPRPDEKGTSTWPCEADWPWSGSVASVRLIAQPASLPHRRYEADVGDGGSLDWRIGPLEFRRKHVHTLTNREQQSILLFGITAQVYREQRRCRLFVNPCPVQSELHGNHLQARGNHGEGDICHRQINEPAYSVEPYHNQFECRAEQKQNHDDTDNRQRDSGSDMAECTQERRQR